MYGKNDDVTKECGPHIMCRWYCKIRRFLRVEFQAGMFILAVWFFRVHVFGDYIKSGAAISLKLIPIPGVL